MSSPQGKYLYLLEGDGTGGRKIAGTGTSSTTAALAEWEALQPGTYTIEVTTNSTRPGRRISRCRSIRCPLTPPAACVTSTRHAHGRIDRD